MSKYIDKDKVLEYIIFGVVGKDITCGELTRAIENLPTIEVMEYPQVEGITPTLVSPEVSEDCISREWVKGICEAMLDEEMLGHMLGYIEDAPSVVVRNNRTTTEQSSIVGEWIDKGDYAECSKCGAKSGTQYDGVEPVPLKTQFCPNCGADMRGRE